MSDGSIGDVSSALMSKLKATTASDWIAERKRAHQAAKAGAAASSSSAAFLPKNYNESAPDGDGDADDARRPASSASAGGMGGSMSNYDLVKSIVSASTKPAAGTGVSTALPPSAGIKRPREEDTAVAQSSVAHAHPVTNGPPPSSGNSTAPPAGLSMKAQLLAKIRAQQQR